MESTLMLQIKAVTQWRKIGSLSNKYYSCCLFLKACSYREDTDHSNMLYLRNPTKVKLLLKKERKQITENQHQWHVTTFFLLVSHICKLPVFIIIDKTVQAFCFLENWMSYVMTQIHQWSVKLGSWTCGGTSVLTLMICLFNFSC